MSAALLYLWTRLIYSFFEHIIFQFQIGAYKDAAILYNTGGPFEDMVLICCKHLLRYRCLKVSSFFSELLRIFSVKSPITFAVRFNSPFIEFQQVFPPIFGKNSCRGFERLYSVTPETLLLKGPRNRSMIGSIKR